jgi:phospholipase/lecithinase/hemolysin
MKSSRVQSIRGPSLLVAAFFFSFASHASGIGHVVVFGDSLSDNGNLLAQTGGVFPTIPIYWNGRQTNGMVWGETLAMDIGASLSNFAIAGAQTGTTNVWDDGPFPGSPYGGLQNQIGDYLSGTMDANALHIVWSGANNFLSIPSDPVAAITEAVTDIVTAVATLKGTGNTHVRVINLPDLGLTPRLIDAGLSAEGAFLTDQFNLALAGGLAGAGLGGVPIIDAAQILRDIVAAPGDYGLTNVTEACIDPSDPGAPGSCLTDLTLDADEYMFWDDVHPTRAVHGIIADKVRLSLVPIPATVWLFGSALSLLCWVRYRAA